MARFLPFFTLFHLSLTFFRPEVPFKLPQQIIYCPKSNLSESPNHFKYRKNILISRLHEQFSRSSPILGHF